MVYVCVCVCVCVYIYMQISNNDMMIFMAEYKFINQQSIYIN